MNDYQALEKQLREAQITNSKLQLEICRVTAELHQADAYIAGVKDAMRGNVKGRGDVDE